MFLHLFVHVHRQTFLSSPDFDWFRLISNNLIQPLPWCSNYHRNQNCASIAKTDEFCFNPLHWAILDSELSDQNDDIKFSSITNPTIDEDLASDQNLRSETISSNRYEYSIDSDGNTRQANWCMISYWNYREKILSNIKIDGEYFNIQSSEIMVDNNNFNSVAMHHQNFQCNQSMKNSNLNPSQQLLLQRNRSSAKIDKVIAKIGLGVTIFKDQSCNVYLYNRSHDCPVYVHSHTFNDCLQEQMFKVIKVMPGHYLKAFDSKLSNWKRSKINEMKSRTTKIDFDSFRFSFFKGFGTDYHRSEIMQCPCWIEVMLQ
ncbi:hypothetical protein NH340_JMT04446 [Sarcoptes scabiei]|nr:hypothetical protein NH340_JMT04446 [Sarcoptes scabiei]